MELKMEELFRSLSESVSEECYTEILKYIEAYLGEDYKSFEQQKYDEDTSDGYKELANVRNSIRRNKTKNLKRAEHAFSQARKEAEPIEKEEKEAKKNIQRDPRGYIRVADKLDAAFNKISNAYKHIKNVRDEEKEAERDTEEARDLYNISKNYEDRIKEIGDRD